MTRASVTAGPRPHGRVRRGWRPRRSIANLLRLLVAVPLLAVVGFLTGRPEWLDIAITYGLLTVIATLAILKFFRHGDLAYDAEEEAS